MLDKPICYRIKGMKNVKHLSATRHLFRYYFILPVILTPTYKRGEGISKGAAKGKMPSKKNLRLQY